MKRSLLFRIVLLVALLCGVSALHSSAAFAQTRPGAPKGKGGKGLSVEHEPSVLNRASPETAQKEKATGLNTNGDNGKKQPTFIKADTLTVKSKDRHFTYVGNVEVDQTDMIMTSDTLDGDYDKNNDITNMIAHSNVTILKGEDIRATGEQAVYNRDLDTMVLTENPEVQQSGSILTGDKVTIFMKENRSLAEGQVRVKMLKTEGSDRTDLNAFTKMQHPTPAPTAAGVAAFASQSGSSSSSSH